MWIDDLIQYGSKDMVILLIGNKSDLKEIRKIDESEIKELTSKYKLQYIETSAKTGDCVKSSFDAKFAGPVPTKKILTKFRFPKYIILNFSVFRFFRISHRR